MDSPFSAYLGSCYSPSDAEIPLIKAFIQQKVEAIGSIDKGIKELEDSLAALKAQREADEIIIQKHRALITPIKRLPPDILSTVFLASLPHVELKEGSLTRNHPAVVISHVCHQWRQLAFNTPLLWSRIQLILPWVNPESYTPQPDVNDREVGAHFDSAIQRLYDIVTVWLARSKGCPLSISMEASEGAAGVYTLPRMGILINSMLKSLERLVDLLRGESQRWEQVRFKFAIDGSNPESESQLSRLLLLTPRDVPVLRKAIIVIDNLWNMNRGPILEPTNHWDWITTIHGQGLQSLTLACPRAVTNLKVSQVKWAGLTELSLWPYQGGPEGGGTHLTTDEALTLLRLCPNLKLCNLAFGTGTPPWDLAWSSQSSSPQPLVARVPDSGSVCRLPHLHSLIIREQSSSSLCRTDRLASALDLPSLHSFSHTGPTNDFDSPNDNPEEGRVRCKFPLVKWVQRFGHTITSINLKQTGVPQSIVERCLEELPNLISLTVRSPGTFVESRNLTRRSMAVSLADGDSLLKKLTPEVIESGGTATISPCCLCPKLEELISLLEPEETVQLVFSEESVLEFLEGRAKASLETVPEVSRVSKLRYVSVRFVNPKVMDLEQELSRKGFNLEGFVGDWSYPAPSTLRAYLLHQIPTTVDPVAGRF